VLDSTLGGVPRARQFELALLGAILTAQAVLFTRLLHNGSNYDEGVYLASLDLLRHGHALGTDVFAPQFPGFYDLLRGLSFLTGIGVAAVRAGLVAITLLGTIGGWLVGRRFGGPVGGLLVAALLTIAPPLDMFAPQVISDTPALAFSLIGLGLATLGGPVAALTAGATLGAAASVKLTALTAFPTAVWLLRGRLRLAVAGFAAVVTAELVAHAGALGDLWTSDVSYHDRARATPAVIPDPYRQIFDQIPRTTPFFWLAIAAALVGVVFAVRGRRLGVWPLWLWVVGGLAFLLLHQPLHYNHLVVFPLTLAVAAGATWAAAARRRPIVLAPLLILLASGFIQQLRQVNEARAPEVATNLAAVRALERLTPPNAVIVDDRPIISFLAHRRVYGPLVDTALLRFRTGSLNDDDVIAALRHADAAVVSRELADPRVLAFLDRHFVRRYDAGGVRIYLKRPRT
jgi:hypothetical protein